MYALLNGKTEEIYVALFKFVRQIVPLNYHNVTIITDFELAQMNAIKSIFKESDHQGWLLFSFLSGNEFIYN